MGPIVGAVGPAAGGGGADGVQFGLGLGAVDGAGPVGRAVDRPVVEQVGGDVGAGGAAGERAPRPVGRAGDEVGAEGVALDVAADAEEVVVEFDGEALEAALVQVATAGGVAVGVPALGVGHGEPAHEVGELAVLARPEDEVEVVGHEHVGTDPHALTLAGLGEDLFEGAVIGVVVKDLETARPAIHDVVGETTGGETQSSGHAGRLPTRGILHNWLLTPFLH